MTNTPHLRPLGEALGTEALGIDLSKPLDDADFAWIADAFANHPVLVFRDQNLGAPELAAFGRRFGTPRRHALIKYRHAENPDVSWLTNVDEAGKVDWYGVKRATDWHTDSTYEDTLPLLAILHAKEVPPEKGGTMFADMAAAYAALPTARQHELAGLTAPARPPDRSRRREAVRRFQRRHRKAVPRSAMARGRPPSRDRPAHPVRQPDAHPRLRRHDSRDSMAAYRGTRRPRNAGALRLLPPLAASATC